MDPVVQGFSNEALTKATHGSPQCQITRGLDEKIDYWWRRADWGSVLQRECEVAQLRVQSSDEVPSVDTKMGLGDHIDWADERIQRFSGAVSTCIA